MTLAFQFSTQGQSLDLVGFLLHVSTQCFDELRHRISGLFQQQTHAFNIYLNSIAFRAWQHVPSETVVERSIGLLDSGDSGKYQFLIEDVDEFAELEHFEKEGGLVGQFLLFSERAV